MTAQTHAVALGTDGSDAVVGQRLAALAVETMRRIRSDYGEEPWVGQTPNRLPALLADLAAQSSEEHVRHLLGRMREMWRLLKDRCRWLNKGAGIKMSPVGLLDEKVWEEIQLIEDNFPHLTEEELERVYDTWSDMNFQETLTFWIEQESLPF